MPRRSVRIGGGASTSRGSSLRTKCSRAEIMVNVRFEGIGLKQEPDAEDRRC